MKIKIINRHDSEIITAIEEDTKIQDLRVLAKEQIHPPLGWIDCMELLSTETRRIFLYEVFIKGTDIPVHLSADGVFFFYSPSGEELVLDNASYDWLSLPPGTYHDEILKELDFRVVDISLS